MLLAIAVADPSQSATERQRLPPEERLRALPPNRRGVALAATQSTTTAIRSYRLYLRDATNAFARPYDVELASDDEARELAALMLDEQVHYPCAEVWDRARLVCTVRRDEFGPNTACKAPTLHRRAACTHPRVRAGERGHTAESPSPLVVGTVRRARGTKRRGHVSTYSQGCGSR